MNKWKLEPHAVLKMAPVLGFSVYICDLHTPDTSGTSPDNADTHGPRRNTLKMSRNNNSPTQQRDGFVA